MADAKSLRIVKFREHKKINYPKIVGWVTQHNLPLSLKFMVGYGLES